MEGCALPRLDPAHSQPCWSPRGLPSPQAFLLDQRMQSSGWNSIKGMDKHKKWWKLRLLVLPSHIPCLGSAPAWEQGEAGAGTSSFHSHLLFFPGENKFFRFFFRSACPRAWTRKVGYKLWRAESFVEGEGKSREPQEGEHSSTLDGWGRAKGDGDPPKTFS